MKAPHLEVADIVRACGSAYLAHYERAAFSQQQQRVLRDILVCRTAALGGHVKKCDQCGQTDVSYDSCRNPARRRDPKCQAAARAKWMEARAAHLLDTVEYDHTVFTLQHDLRPVALQNKQVVYGILFRSAAESLHTIAQDPKHLGARIGFLSILHTWGQKLLHHPHIHCVIPGGGLSPNDRRWIPSRNGFFLPVRVLSVLFKTKVLSYLHEAFRTGQLRFHGQWQHLAKEASWKRLLRPLERATGSSTPNPLSGAPGRFSSILLATPTREPSPINDSSAWKRVKSVSGGRTTATGTANAP